MSRSDWGILTALAGLAALFVAFGTGLYLASLNYRHEQRYQPYRYSVEQSAQVAGGSKAAISQLPQYRTPCQQPEGKGESELCAQWQAANAAQDSAFWTKWGVWIGIVGSSLLLWQITLTRRAVEETSDATEAMQKANSIATGAYSDQINSSRPLLMVEQDSFELWAWPHETGFNDGHKPPFAIPVEGFKLKFGVKNFGQSPCWIEAIWFGFNVSLDDQIPPQRPVQFRDAVAGFIPPGDSFDVGGAIYRLSAESLEQINSRSGGIEIIGALQYRAPAGHIFNTEFAFSVGIGDHLKSAHPKPDKGYWRDGRIKAPKMLIHDPIEYLHDQSANH